MNTKDKKKTPMNTESVSQEQAFFPSTCKF